jgi:hypothetical protein
MAQEKQPDKKAEQKEASEKNQRLLNHILELQGGAARQF